MERFQLLLRTREFALDVIRLVSVLPREMIAHHIARQLLRAGTSVGANYRAACHARTRAEFIAKMGIVEEECDECGFWLDLLAETSIVPASRLDPLRSEAAQILRMTASSIITARRRMKERSKT